MGADGFQIVVQLGAFGLVAWLVFFAVTRAIPDRERQFLAELDRKRAEFAALLERMQDQFAEILRQQRTDFAQALAEMNRDHREERASFEREIRGMARAIQQLTMAVLIHHSATSGNHPETQASARDLLELLRRGDEEWQGPPPGGATKGGEKS